MDNIEKLYGEWLSLQPLKEEDSIRLNQKFMLEFNYNSNHMEYADLWPDRTFIAIWESDRRSQHERLGRNEST